MSNQNNPHPHSEFCPKHQEHPNFKCYLESVEQKYPGGILSTAPEHKKEQLELAYISGMDAMAEKMRCIAEMMPEDDAERQINVEMMAIQQRALALVAKMTNAKPQMPDILAN